MGLKEDRMNPVEYTFDFFESRWFYIFYIFRNAAVIYV